MSDEITCLRKASYKTNALSTVVEHLKQTGSVEDQPRAPAMERDLSDKSDKSNKSNRSNISSSSPSPPPSSRKVYTPPSPVQPKFTTTVPPPSMDRPARSPPVSPLEKPSGVRFSDRKPTARPSGTRTYSNVELSTVDQKWGRLFESEGKPTKRLGEFLRGLANHIVSGQHGSL